MATCAHPMHRGYYQFKNAFIVKNSNRYYREFNHQYAYTFTMEIDT